MKIKRLPPEELDSEEEPDLICPTCGAQRREYDHALNMRYVRLVAAVFIPAGVGVPVSIRELGRYADIDRVTVSYGKHFGLVEKCYYEDGRERRGWWQLTQVGADFFAGLIPLPEQVTTYRNKVIRRSTKKVYVHQVVPWQGLTYESVLAMSRVTSPTPRVAS